MSDPTLILAQRFSEALTAAFGPEFATTDPILRPAQNAAFGDYQANLAMSLAKRLGSNPRQVATTLLEHLKLDGLCEKPQIAGPGFINLRLTADFLQKLAATLLADPRLGIPPQAAQTVVIDYSAPNVAKEMHVGHIRSTVIGDALSRVLEFLGHRVIRQNHMGDWGTQFGMLIEFMLKSGLADRSSAGISDLNELYRQSKALYDADPAFAELARKRVVALQSGDGPTLALWKKLVDESEKHFSRIYARLGVRLTPADTCAESFYNPMLPSIVQQVRDKGLAQVSEGATCIFVPGYTTAEGNPLPMIIQKSDGGFLYATTDLAAIHHRLKTLRGDRLIYVTDSRQSQHFSMLFEAARMLGWLDGSVLVQHVPFGTILGEDNRPFKTRSGDTVKLTDLLDEALERAMAIVTEKSPETSAEDRQKIADVVGIGAVKYGDLANDRVKDYIFSWNRMLAMEGNTAPYLQYAYARIRSIFRKADEAAAASWTHAAINPQAPEERALLLKLLQMGPVIRSVAESLEPHRLCTYLYELASVFSSFYQNCPVLKSEGPQRAARLALCDITSRALALGLDLLGIQTLERM